MWGGDGDGSKSSAADKEEWQDLADDGFESNASSDDDDDDFPGETNQYKKRGACEFHQADLFDLATQADVPTQGKDGAKEAELPELSGWVEQTVPAWFLTLQRRFACLKDKQLRFYEDDRPDARLLGHLDLDLIDIEVNRQYGMRPAASRTKSCCMGRKAGGVYELLVNSEPRASITLVPTGSRKVFELSLPSEQEAEAWASCLNIHESRSLKLGSSGGKIVQQKYWWRSPHITPEQLLKCAKTGDLLLFRSRGTKPKLIRMASGSRARYDHVGLVVELADSGLAILEATGEEGVGVLPWQTFLDNGWHELYAELALRRVHFPRTQERLMTLQQWIREMIGKPYVLSISKLMARKSVDVPSGDEDYFCSQLCAKALKILGVLPDGPHDKASSSYWPSTFSAKLPPIPCREGCRFDQADLIIDFSLSDDPEKYKKRGGGKQRDDTTKFI